MTAFPFHQYFHPDVPSIGNLLDAYQVITKDVETAEMFQSHDAYSLNAIDFAKSLEGDYKEQKAQLKEGLKAFKQGIDSFIKAEQDGHKIRAAYLDNIKKDITKILFDTGYILNYKFEDEGYQGLIKIALKYHPETKQPAFKSIKRISRPGLRMYKGADKIPRVLNGLGIAILSTSQSGFKPRICFCPP